MLFLQMSRVCSSQDPHNDLQSPIISVKWVLMPSFGLCWHCIYVVPIDQNTHIHMMKINKPLKIHGDVLNLLSNVVPNEPSWISLAAVSAFLTDNYLRTFLLFIFLYYMFLKERTLCAYHFYTRINWFVTGPSFKNKCSS